MDHANIAILFLVVLIIGFAVSVFYEPRPHDRPQGSVFSIERRR